MNNIIIELKRKKKLQFGIPENFKEMTGLQFIEACRYILYSHAGKEISETIYSILSGVPIRIFKKLDFFHKYSIRELLEFILTEKEFSFSEQKIFSITVNHQKYYGQQHGFGNTTWEEFVFADQLLIDKKYKELIAVLYRPQRVKWDGESDRRIPFTTYGITKRYKEFAEIDDTLIYAIITNYRAMRTASLEEIYTEIFPYKHSFDNEENPNQSSQNENMFSWANVHTNLLGDDLSNESKYLQLNVHTVLNRLNTIIKENRTKKKYHG